MTPIVLNISGMSCGHCLNAVRKALDGARGVEVQSVQMGRAELRFDDGVTSVDRIRELIAEAGYDATPVGA